MIRICKRCGKKEHKRKTTSPYCNDCRVYLYNIERRKKLIKEHRCISCGSKIKPKIVYPRRCDKCLEKIENRKKLKKNG